MSMSTNFPSGYPFYGGITPEYGTGKHQDWDPILEMGETFLAYYINTLEHRVDQLEHIVNQLENFILYPNGSINNTYTRLSDPASGYYYKDSPLFHLASGVNELVNALNSNGTVTASSISWYPFYVGTVTP